MAQWQNDDGLTVRFGQDQARETKSLMGKASVDGPVEYMVVDLVWDDLPTFTTDLNNDGTNNGFSDQDAYIPAGSYITKASLIVETAFTSAGATTLSIGTANKAGTAIDADGIDATIAKAALAADLAVVCNGAQVAGTTLVTADAYLTTTVAVGPFTAGKAKLVIEYIPVTV
jgi:hypothetical protein